MASLVLHCAHFRRGAEGVGDALRRAVVIGHEGQSDMTIVENGVVGAIGLLDLIERLGDEEALETVADDEGERRLEAVQLAQRREFAQCEQQAMASLLGLQRRRPIWFKIRCTSGLVRVVSDGGTTR